MVVIGRRAVKARSLGAIGVKKNSRLPRSRRGTLTGAGGLLISGTVDGFVSGDGIVVGVFRLVAFLGGQHQEQREDVVESHHCPGPEGAESPRVVL